MTLTQRPFEEQLLVANAQKSTDLAGGLDVVAKKVTALCKKHK